MKAYDELLIYYSLCATAIDHEELAVAMMKEKDVTAHSLRAHFQALVDAILAEPGREELAQPWIEAIQTLAD